MAVAIPEISDEQLADLARRIKPVVRFARRTTSRSDELVTDPEGDLFFIKDVDPRTTAFTWDPEPTRRAEEVNPNSYRSIRTRHTYGAPVFFKPSVAEVLAQISEGDLERCVAFETESEGLGPANCDPGGYHVTVTHLYERFPER